MNSARMDDVYLEWIHQMISFLSSKSKNRVEFSDLVARAEFNGSIIMSQKRDAP